MKVNESRLKQMKEDGEAVAMLTAYDAAEAELLDRAGVDVLLVGDSVGNVRLGYDDTLPVSLEESVTATAAVARGAEDAMVVADMPFGSYGGSVERSVENAQRFLKEGADAVKLETPVGGEFTVDVVDRLTELGVPVMGHTGLTPQHVNRSGYEVKGGEEADRLVETACRLDDAGVFSLVLEMVEEPVAARVADEVEAVTIGIGAGREVDGQVLVVDDLLGVSEDVPSFVKQYADLRAVISEAVEEYVDEVKDGEFPSDEHVFSG